MRRTGRQLRLVAGSVVVALSLMALTSSAPARTFQTSTAAIEIYFREMVLEGLGTRVMTCEVNLQGNLTSRSVTKSSGSVIGSVFGAGGWCKSGARFSVLRETLPWSLSYISFQGSLPAIRLINLQLDNGGFTASEGTGTCLFEFTRANGFVFSLGLESGAVTEVITNERAQVRKTSEAAECRGERIFRGTGELHATVIPPRLTMTLI
jgi:hypothetical protein